MKKTKIICTIGPASTDKETLSKMADAGMDIVRLNFSHGNHEDFAKKITCYCTPTFFVISSAIIPRGFTTSVRPAS